MRYQNKRFIWQIVMCCETLVEILSQCQDDFPDMKYNDMYMLIETLINLKYSAIELIGRDGENERISD